MVETIKKYERSNNEQNISKELVSFLYKNIDKEDELKKIYKNVLKQLNRYDNNYYAKICILINTLKFKKKQNKNLNLPYDIFYLNLPIKGKLKIVLNGKKREIKTVEKKIEYLQITEEDEGLGEKKSKDEKEILIKEAKEILENDNNLLKRGMDWERQYKKYIIRTYGRWSKQYEDYMTTLFDVGFLPISPNILLKIKKQYLKEAIEEKLEYINK